MKQESEKIQENESIEDFDNEELAEIIPKPIKDLIEGVKTEVISSSSGRSYFLMVKNGIYSCTCPAWLMQKSSIRQRTCKHLQEYRGKEAELFRVGHLGVIKKNIENYSKKVASSVSSSKKGFTISVMLAEKWNPSIDPTNWLMSEKLDGVRGYWTGKTFYSRNGKEYEAPQWFKDGLPDFPLDGELFKGRGLFNETSSIIRSGASEEWKQIKYLVFDAPELQGGFEDRIHTIQSWFEKNPHKYTEVVTQIICKDPDHLQEILTQILNIGGEGIMLRKSRSAYLRTRSTDLLKVKVMHDIEARVLGHQTGKGKYEHMVGALEVELPNGIKFRVGSGLNDKDRKNPPQIGDIISIKYQELTPDGIPRFPVYRGIRTDITWSDLTSQKSLKPKKTTIKK